MSFGAGHMMDMNNRIKQNRAQRPSNRGKFKENNRSTIHANSEITKRPQFVSIPGKELDEIKLLIRQRAKKEQRKIRLFYSVSIGIGLILLIGFLIGLN
jgi:hypothetical protein